MHFSSSRHQLIRSDNSSLRVCARWSAIVTISSARHRFFCDRCNRNERLKVRRRAPRQLNLGLLFFAVLLIIAGAATGSLFIVFFGVIFLVAAALPTRRKTGIPQRQPSPARPAPQARVTPPPMQTAKAESHVSPPQPRPAEPPPTSATAAVFPSTLFPSLTPSPPLRYEATPESRKGEAPDEFLTLVALLGLLKLFSKR